MFIKTPVDIHKLHNPYLQIKTPVDIHKLHNPYLQIV
jgi:hypothetical protein